MSSLTGIDVQRRMNGIQVVPTEAGNMESITVYDARGTRCGHLAQVFALRFGHEVAQARRFGRAEEVTFGGAGYLLAPAVLPPPDALSLLILDVRVEFEIFRETVDPIVTAVGRLLAVGCPLRALERAESLLADGYGDRAVLVGAVRLAVQTICRELQVFDADKDERFAGRGVEWFVAKQAEIETAYPCLAPHEEPHDGEKVPVEPRSEGLGVQPTKMARDPEW